VAILATVTAACGTTTYSSSNADSNGAGSSSAGSNSVGADQGQGSAAARGASTITETGSSLLAPLMQRWAAAYQQLTPGMTVSAKSTSSGTGIAAAAAGTADLGSSDAYLSSGDLVKTPSLLNIPLVVSAQTVVYNLPTVSAADHVRLNGQVLAAIYRGDVTRWNDPMITAINPHLALPDLKIVPVRRSDSSGDTFLFTSYLSTQDPQWNDKVGYGTTANWPAAAGEQAAKGSVTMLNTCRSTPGCVTYEGISYLAMAQAAGLGEAELANAAGRYSLPNATTISASIASFVSITPPNETISMIDGPAVTGYPIINYEYAVVSAHQQSAQRASQLQAFLRWVITTGNLPKYVDAVGFQPLPQALVSLGQHQIGEIGP
jgi:phosphate transport system substrate-binding protein